MIVVNTHEAKTNLSKLLKLVAEKHETVRICKNGKVMAELVEPKAPDKKNHLKTHPSLTGVVFHENPAAPLGDEFIPEAMVADKGDQYNVSS